MVNSRILSTERKYFSSPREIKLLFLRHVVKRRKEKGILQGLIHLGDTGNDIDKVLQTPLSKIRNGFIFVCFMVVLPISAAFFFLSSLF